MSETEYDRQMMERALMKATRRARLALVKAGRIAIKLAADERIKEKVDWFQAASGNCARQLEEIEAIVGFKLDPVAKKGEEQSEEDI
jgi:hypothetical protein